MKNNLVVCFNCKEVQRITEYDTCPEYVVNGETLEYEIIDKNDREGFFERHLNHKTGCITELEGEIISRGYFSDPSCESYLKATDGTRTYIVRAWRENAADKMKYELVEENILVRLEHIGFDSKEFLDSIGCLLKKERLERNLTEKILDIIDKNMGSVQQHLQQLEEYDLSQDRQIATVTRNWKEKVLSEINGVVKNISSGQENPDEKISEIIRKKLDDIKYEIVKYIDLTNNF